jgi:hypothetical protein
MHRVPTNHIVLKTKGRHRRPLIVFCGINLILLPIGSLRAI